MSQPKDTETYMSIRIEKKLRDEFNRSCQGRYMTASHILRAFMQQHIEKYPPPSAEHLAAEESFQDHDLI